MRKKVLLAAGIMLSLISLIVGALVVMLRVVTVSASAAAQKDIPSFAGWVSLFGLALGLSIAIYGARRPKPAGEPAQPKAPPEK